MKKFIIKKFGKAVSDNIYIQVFQRRDELLQEFLGLNNQEQRALRDKILPLISLYEVMLSDKDYKAFAKDFIKEYLVSYRNEKLIKKITKMEKRPFFEYRFMNLVNKIANSGDFQGVLDATETGYKFDIEKSLWNTVCINEKHPELIDIYYEAIDNIFNTFTRYNYARSELINKHMIITLTKKAVSK